MKVKTSISLSADVLQAVDQLATQSSRSEVIEQAIREFLLRGERALRGARDIEIYNKYADEYEEVIQDVLRYSAPIDVEDNE
jgi:metal-responsive CopG/Arc/MetJ family transcriptional regulator